MRVTFVLPALSLNGGIRVVAIYGRELMKLGHQVAFVARRADRPRLRDLLLGRARFGRHAEFLPEFFHDMEDRVTFVTSRRPLQPPDLPDADFLIATWWETVEWTRDMPAAKGRKVHLMQDYEMFPYLPLDRVARTYAQDTIKIAVSGWVAEQVLAHHGRPAAAVIHNAVDTDRFAFAAERHNPAMTLGSLLSSAPRKNSQLAAETLEVLRARGFPAGLRAFHSSALPRGLRGRAGLELHYRPPQAQIPKLYQSCDLWLFTSLSEGFGLPIVEALSCGTPVLATRAGAAPQLIRPGVNGYLAAPDPQAFADAVIAHSALDRDRKRQMSRAARESVLGWDWGAATRELVETLSGAAGG